MPAVVERRWAEVNIQSGIRRSSYDIEGTDAEGPFHGTFDDLHIRQRQSKGARTPAGGKTP